MTLASSLIPANSCVPGSPVLQEPADASTMSQLPRSPVSTLFSSQWEERDQLFAKYLSLRHWLKAFEGNLFP